MRSLFYVLLALASCVTAIWPAPASFTSGTSVLWISSDVEVTYNCDNVRRTFLCDIPYLYTEQSFQSTTVAATSGNSSFSSQGIVQPAIKRALDTLFTQGLVPWKQYPRNMLASMEPSDSSSKTYVRCLTITQTGTDNASTFKPLAGEVDESYNLTVATDGTAKIAAVSSTGVLHALESFTQLFYHHSTGNGVYTNLAPIAIVDTPKFPHRGLNMDVSRNWFPVPNILRTIDALSMNKFNRLHIHMTDSQSWPMQIPALPLLAEEGAYHTGLSYTPDDIKQIQTYAIERGVEVYIEFDMPGHTTSIGLGYPDLVAAADAHPWDTYCAEPPCGTLKLNYPPVDDFLNKLFADVLPRVSPYSSYFHTGGDEVNKMAYTLDPTVNSSDPVVIGPLIQKMVDRNHGQIRAAGMTPVVWEEMLLEWNLTLGKDVVVQAWLSDASVASVTAKGHKALAGNYNFWVSYQSL